LPGGCAAARSSNWPGTLTRIVLVSTFRLGFGASLHFLAFYFAARAFAVFSGSGHDRYSFRLACVLTIMPDQSFRNWGSEQLFQNVLSSLFGISKARGRDFSHRFLMVVSGASWRMLPIYIYAGCM
jgi:hypothetical protein